MVLFKTMDGLFKGTRYLAWGIAALGIVGSIILFFANIGLGLTSAMVFIAALLLSIGVTLLLLPKVLQKKKLEGKGKYVVGAICIVAATAVMGIVYFSVGGFPSLNLIFVVVSSKL